MCATCGCGNDDAVITIPHDHNHEHPHDHGHPHDHEHDHPHGPDTHTHPRATETLELEQAVLAKNDRLAEHNRAWLARRGIAAFNITSSPGAGKTTLLERTIRELPDIPVAVIEGDQETLRDADRIRAAGCPVVQVNTGAGCHLDAAMVSGALDALEPPPDSVLLIENVGNLVCPALFDLGERDKVVLISVTEGTDKPLKYPHMFSAAGLVIVNKTDLLPYVDFDMEMFRNYAHSVNPGVEIIPMSVTSGDGVDGWYRWISRLHTSVNGAAAGSARG